MIDYNRILRNEFFKLQYDDFGSSQDFNIHTKSNEIKESTLYFGNASERETFTTEFMVWKDNSGTGSMELYRFNGTVREKLNNKVGKVIIHCTDIGNRFVLELTNISGKFYTTNIIMHPENITYDSTFEVPNIYQDPKNIIIEVFDHRLNTGLTDSSYSRIIENTIILSKNFSNIPQKYKDMGVQGGYSTLDPDTGVNIYEEPRLESSYRLLNLNKKVKDGSFGSGSSFKHIKEIKALDINGNFITLSYNSESDSPFVSASIIKVQNSLALHESYLPTRLGYTDFNEMIENSCFIVKIESNNYKADKALHAGKKVVAVGDDIIYSSGFGKDYGSEIASAISKVPLRNSSSSWAERRFPANFKNISYASDKSILTDNLYYEEIQGNNITGGLDPIVKMYPILIESNSGLAIQILWATVPRDTLIIKDELDNTNGKQGIVPDVQNVYKKGDIVRFIGFNNAVMSNYLFTFIEDNTSTYTSSSFDGYYIFEDKLYSSSGSLSGWQPTEGSGEIDSFRFNLNRSKLAINIINESGKITKYGIVEYPLNYVSYYKKSED